MYRNQSIHYRRGAALEEGGESGMGQAPWAPAGEGAAADSAQLRILWVKVGGLWPVNTGGRLRSFHIIEELARRHQVTVMTTHHPSEDPRGLEKNLPQAREVVSIPYAAPKKDEPRFLLALMRSWLSPLPVDLYKNRVEALRRRVDEALRSGDYDLCVADFMFAVPNVPMRSNVPVVFFSHNVEYMIWKRLCATDGNPLRRALLALEWRKMRRCEHQACRGAEVSVCVSERDRAQLESGGRAGKQESPIHAIPTGVDVNFFRPDPEVAEKPLELVFTGSMDWQPNHDAITWFIREILPRLRREEPDVTLSVVGRNPSDTLRALADEAGGVHVTGTVDDIRPHVHRAALYVVPLRIGGGTRLKIFEALAMGKAVVSTSIGAEGLPLEEGRHIRRADQAEDFAEQVLRLLRDGGERRRLGQAGRALMEERFAWARVAEVFEERCREALR